MPSPRISPKVARLLGLQLLVVVVALVVAYAFVVFNTQPNQPGTTGGIDAINSTIVWIAIAGIFIALGYIHVNFARQMLSESKGTRRGVESW